MYFDRKEASWPVHTTCISLVQCGKGAGSGIVIMLISSASLNEQFVQIPPDTSATVYSYASVQKFL